MRADRWFLLALGACAAVRAAEPVEAPQPVAPPDAGLLEFLADWPEEDRQWLEVELDTTPSDGTPAAPPSRETTHE